MRRKEKGGTDLMEFLRQSARARAHAREKGKLIRIERPRNVFAML